MFYKSITPSYWGMWMKDSSPHELLGEKFWLAKGFDGNILYYYNSQENLKTRDVPDGSYELSELYGGTDNVVYNGSFYYHRKGYNEIIKFDLVKNESAAKVEIPSAAFEVSGSLNFVLIVLYFILAHFPAQCFLFECVGLLAAHR